MQVVFATLRSKKKDLTKLQLCNPPYELLASNFMDTKVDVRNTTCREKNYL